MDVFEAQIEEDISPKVNQNSEKSPNKSNLASDTTPKAVDRQSQESFKNNELEELDEEDDEGEIQELNIPSESKISKILSESTTKVVISLVLILLCLLPITQPETFLEGYLLHENGLQILVDVYDNSGS